MGSGPLPAHAPAPRGTDYGPELRDTIREHLAAHDLRRVDDGDGRRRAAVAVVLVDSAPTAPVVLADRADRPEPGMDGLAGGPAFLLCRRAARLNRHAGQWALPGGRVDPGETVADAARRELYEELGVDLDGASVLGYLDDYPTRSGYVVSPVVLWAGGSVSLTPDPGEVRAVYNIGLAELRRDDSPRYIEIPESDRPVVQVPLGSFLLHAPTAAVMLQFRRVGLEGALGRRVHHLEQPVFAWR
jgi:ADP-ribose pyrophosphatase YjhB (NUDIX family)